MYLSQFFQETSNDNLATYAVADGTFNSSGISQSEKPGMHPYIHVVFTALDSIIIKKQLVI